MPNDERALEKILRQAGPASESLTILPFWVSERAPTWPEHLDGIIHGLTQATTAADLLHGTTAAVFHRLAQILIQLENAIGRAKKIVVSGGILQSPASLQILADSLGRDVQVCADREASLRGAAVHALEQLGKIVPPPKLEKSSATIEQTPPRHTKRGRVRINSKSSSVAGVADPSPSALPIKPRSRHRVGDPGYGR